MKKYVKNQMEIMNLNINIKCNEEFELTDRLYFKSDIQKYFEYIIKNIKHYNLPIQIYINKI